MNDAPGKSGEAKGPDMRDEQLSESLAAKRLLLHHVAQQEPRRYLVKVGYVRLKTMNQVLFGVFVGCVVLTSCLLILGIWEVLTLDTVVKTVPTMLIVFVAVWLFSVANKVLGPSQYLTEEEEADLA